MNLVHKNLMKLEMKNMPKVLSNVREDILKVTRDTLVKSGYSKISMREIAEKCGIGTGTLYNYFKSKQEIIAYILISDWDIMIRKISQSNKSCETSLKKLEFIFTELKYFMNNTHNIWNENFFDELDTSELVKVTERKKLLMVQISDAISGAMEGDESYKKDDLLCEILAGLFISFVNVSNVGFEDLRPYIIKLLN